MEYRVDLKPEHLVRANIGRRYWDVQVSDLPDGPHRKYVEKYVQNIRRMRKEGWGLLMWGANGRGKTTSACCILKSAMELRYSAYCIHSDILKSCFIDKQAFDPDESVVDRVHSVDFLLIEDLGKEYRGKGSGWAELCFENVIRKRTQNLQPTLITTNANPAELSEQYKTSAVSLLMECTVPVEFKGKDLRRDACSDMIGWFKDG